jgi:hypothetical protein
MELGAPYWKREFSHAFGEAALFALTCAAKTKGTREIVQLIQALEGEARYAFVKWVRAYSPILLKLENERIKGIATPICDPNYKPFDLDGASVALDAIIGRPLGLDVENAFPEGKKARKRARAQFRKTLHQLLNPRKPPKVDPTRTPKTGDLGTATHADLHWLFQDCIERIASGNATLAGPAAELCDAIRREWKRRADNGDYFVWPRTEADPSSVKLGKLDSPELGILGALGYRVGKARGRTRAVRLLLLDAVFSDTLPPINGSRYMAQWGAPNTSPRLKKMADCLASWIRNSKRIRSLDRTVAIEQWSSDLLYLYDTYYVGRFGFGFPRIE